MDSSLALRMTAKKKDVACYVSTNIKKSLSLSLSQISNYQLSIMEKLFIIFILQVYVFFQHIEFVERGFEGKPDC